MDTWKITLIDEDKDHVHVTFEIDGVVLDKRIQGVPRDSVEATRDYFDKWIAAYKRGKEQTKAVPTDPEVTKLVGKKQEAQAVKPA